MKSKIISAIIAVLLAVSVCAILLKSKENGKYLKMTVEGKTSYYSLDKDMCKEKNGVKIRIENNIAYVEESTCRDKICVNAGKLENTGDIAVCLPNDVAVSISENRGENELYSITFTDAFDTVVTLYGYAESKEEFRSYSDYFEGRMKGFSDLFNAFDNCEVNNLYTVNKNAGKSAVNTDKTLVEGILFALDAQKMTEGYTDPSFGAVTKLWRDFINGSNEKPTDDMLSEASLHCGIDKIKVTENSIYISDKSALIDVGATAKGFCTQILADELVSMGMTDFCINAGGNIVVRGNKKGMDGWEIGIQNPFGKGSILTVQVKNKAVVTSGSYRRYRENYNHIIDVKTLYPSDKYASVTVICDDSALADAFSTAFFCMDIDEGKVLAEKFGMQVMWITHNGSVIRTGDR